MRTRTTRSLLGIAVAWAVWSSTAAVAQVPDFRIATSLSPGNPEHQLFLNAFVKNVDQASKGRIKVVLLTFGAVSVSQLGSQVKIGVVQGALAPASLFASDLGADAFRFSFTSRTAKEVRSQGGFVAINEFWAKANVRVLAWPFSASRSYVFLARQPGRSAITLKLTDQKILAFGPAAPLLKDAGVQTIQMSPQNVVASLKEGAFDGLVAFPSQFRSFKLSGVVHLRLFPSVQRSDAVLVVNLEYWRKLPPDLSAILDSAARDFEVASDAFAEQDAQSFEGELSKAEIQTLYFDRAQLQLFFEQRAKLVGKGSPTLDAALPVTSPDCNNCDCDKEDECKKTCEKCKK